MEWSFDEPQPGWRPVRMPNPVSELVTAEHTDGALRVTLHEGTRRGDGVPVGSVSVSVPFSSGPEWGDVVVRIRSDSTVSVVGLRVNGGDSLPASGPSVPLVRDGSVQTYRLPWPDNPNGPIGQWIAAGRPVRAIGVFFQAPDGPGSVDVLSLSVAPIEELYRDPPVGVRQVAHEGRSRRALYTHAPSSVRFRVSVPRGGRFDVGLRTLRPEVPVTFRVRVEPLRGAALTLSEETVTGASGWLQRSIDLSTYAGETVSLILDNESPSAGAIGLWSAPTLTGSAPPMKPNVIFYVIDGGGSDHMSLYGYNRPTTPNLEALAKEGAVFEWAHSNASWTYPSTRSFMTGLQTSVVSAEDVQFDAIPEEAPTMAERFHGAGYQTAVFTTNPNAGSPNDLAQGVDHFRDEGAELDALSSEELHREFWEWRAAYPGAPYWAHFQTTDVHDPNTSQPPFAGLFAPVGTSERIARENAALIRWRGDNVALYRSDQDAWTLGQWAGAGVDRLIYNDGLRAIYDETLAHQDHELGRLVERLKQAGEWANTLLVITADHGIDAGSEDFVTALLDESARTSEWTILRSTVSRVPLMFVWPGRIEGGQRLREQVSLIDVLPTVLELAGLPEPEVLQGQSLAPLLLGRDGWEPRPVILDELSRNPRTGNVAGQIEVIDGRWGASLSVRREDPGSRPPLLLYDLIEDPLALVPINDRHPDLVAHYTEFLTRQREAHELLARRFTLGGAVELTAEQLETLRTLGYIR
jgi:arylsulfatase A-like enzyme